MKWLAALQMDNEPVTLCRLMNVFRRKGMKIADLTMSAEAGGFTLLALVETGAEEVEHLRNFLRSTDGVRKVACYRHEPSENAAFALDDAEPASLTEFLETLPGTNAAAAGDGRYVVEFPEGSPAGEVESTQLAN